MTAALIEQGIEPSRMVLVEFNPMFCRLLRNRYPEATVVQGDAYGLKRLLGRLLRQPASAVVSGLPLFTKPLRLRLRLFADAFALLQPGSPFVQFTYALVPPIPGSMPACARVERTRLVQPAAGSRMGLSQGLILHGAVCCLSF